MVGLKDGYNRLGGTLIDILNHLFKPQTTRGSINSHKECESPAYYYNYFHTSGYYDFPKRSPPSESLVYGKAIPFVFCGRVRVGYMGF